jgi:predicted ATPase
MFVPDSALNAPGTISHNLPVQSTPFIGREKELDAARILMERDAVRLVTFTGPGGTGKTRLAIRAAERLHHLFPDGIYFVPLAPIIDPELVVPTIAQLLGVIEAGSKPLIEAVKTHLLNKKAVLLLDNF